MQFLPQPVVQMPDHRAGKPGKLAAAGSLRADSADWEIYSDSPGYADIYGMKKSPSRGGD
jgi:hypothetical protein